MTPSGIEPATLRLVAQCLNQPRSPVSMEEDLICSCGQRDIPTVGMASRRISNDADVSDESLASNSRMTGSRACRRRYTCTLRRQPSRRNMFSTCRKSGRWSIKSQAEDMRSGPSIPLSTLTCKYAQCGTVRMFTVWIRRIMATQLFRTVEPVFPLCINNIRN